MAKYQFYVFILWCDGIYFYGIVALSKIMFWKVARLMFCSLLSLSLLVKRYLSFMCLQG